MISSDVGLATLRNWHTKKTLLVFVSPVFADAASFVEVRVGPEPPSAERLVLTIEDTGETLPLDLYKAEFRLADADEEPPPVKAWLGKFVCFLFLKIKDGRGFVFGERFPTA
jgi:hypothetical protein